mmetsp:Transcript_39486/g.71900  ORF Transcript_39486/g.71900 Transcript_39486/m.71900 type:complete len:229 (+) Transcript_39486:229-915(+)
MKPSSWLALCKDVSVETCHGLIELPVQCHYHLLVELCHVWRDVKSVVVHYGIDFVAWDRSLVPNSSIDGLNILRANNDEVPQVNHQCVRFAIIGDALVKHTLDSQAVALLDHRSKAKRMYTPLMRKELGEGCVGSRYGCGKARISSDFLDIRIEHTKDEQPKCNVKQAKHGYQAEVLLQGDDPEAEGDYSPCGKPQRLAVQPSTCSLKGCLSILNPHGCPAEPEATIR